MILKIFRFINSLLINNIKFIFIKIFHLNNFKFQILNYISPLNVIDLQGNGKLIFGKKINIPSKSIIGVRENGLIHIDDGSFINNNCYIISHKKIYIGKNVCIGPNTVIVDHNHQYGKDGVEKKKFDSKEIIIEDGAWIGANCVILKGTKIGKNSVIGAGTVLNCDVPDNSIFIQKRTNFIKKMVEKDRIL